MLQSPVEAHYRRQTAAALFCDGLCGPDHNLLSYVFLDPSARRFVVGWAARALRPLAEFRADTAGWADEAKLTGLIQELRAGCASFGRWWDEQRVMGREGGERAFKLADGRVLRLH